MGVYGGRVELKILEPLPTIQVVKEYIRIKIINVNEYVFSLFLFIGFFLRFAQQNSSGEGV